jgi:UDP-3-O-[3-hydroxymyristoyl] glucosamine N-acyltransferase
MAGQVGVRDHVHIGDQAQLGAQAGVSADVPAGETYLGSPATPIKQQKTRFAAFAKLPDMRKAFRQLQKDVEQLKAEIHPHEEAA